MRQVIITNATSSPTASEIHAPWSTFARFEEKKATYDFFRPLLKDQQSAKDFEFPAQYMFKNVPKDLPTGYVQSYHLTVQRQLSNNMTFEVSYVGEHGVKLQVLADYNQAAPNAVTSNCNASGLAGSTSGCLPLQARRPVKNFTGIEETLPDGFLERLARAGPCRHRTARAWLAY